MTQAEAIALSKINFGMSTEDLRNQRVIKDLESRGASIEQLRRLQDLNSPARWTQTKGLMLNSAATMPTWDVGSRE